MKVFYYVLCASMALLAPAWMLGCKKQPKPEGTRFYRFAGMMGQNGPAVASASDGSFAFGSSDINNYVWVTKVGPNNEVLWRSSIGYSNNLICTPVAINKAGKVCAAKSAFNYQAGFYEITASWLDNSGKVAKEAVVADSMLGFQKFELFATSDGGYLFVIAQYSPNVETLLVKTDEAGIWQWKKSLPYMSYNALEQQSDGSFVALCNGGSVLLEFDSAGTVYSTHNPGFNTSMSSLSAIRKLDDGGFVVAGSSITSSISILKIKADMSLAWIMNHPPMGSSGFGNATGLELDKFGNIYAACNFTNSIGQMDNVIIKADANGKQLFLKHLGGANAEWFAQILPKGNGFVVLGNTASFSDQESEIKVYYTHMDSEGNFK